MENVTRMNLVINDKELARFLFRFLMKHQIKITEPNWFEVNNFRSLELFTGYQTNEKFVKKLSKKIEQAVRLDLEQWYNKLVVDFEKNGKPMIKLLNANMHYVVDKLGGEDVVLSAYKKSNHQDFVKTAGSHFSTDTTLIRRTSDNDPSKLSLIRNTINNEIPIQQRINNNYPFWFIDSGYTNFLGKKKIWHRLCRNHIHHTKDFIAPVDRLHMFDVFPKQWREGGSKILLIEPGDYICKIFNINKNEWVESITSSLRELTDIPVVTREKANKKVRTNLYKELLDDDYYCVVNFNSNAATEAIWAGVPVITLGGHITRSVSSTKLKHINNLHKPNLANWLCTLSYSQFTYEELVNGDAVNIAKRYYD